MNSVAHCFLLEGETMKEEMTLAAQLERMSRWKSPIVDNTAAVVLSRTRANSDSVEYLVTQRLKGAARGHYQAHHGGHLQVTDKSVLHSASRETLEETGFIVPPEHLLYAGKFGPELYRSYIVNDAEQGRLLVISDEEAEPGVAFTLELFVADVTLARRLSDTDMEVKEVGWLTLEEMIEIFGQSPTFNYWTFFLAAVSTSNKVTRLFRDSSPGSYSFDSW